MVTKPQGISVSIDIVKADDSWCVEASVEWVDRQLSRTAFFDCEAKSVEEALSVLSSKISREIFGTDRCTSSRVVPGSFEYTTDTEICGRELGHFGSCW